MPSRLRRPDRFRLRYGPVAVVTGASDGIGRAIADVLAEAGLDLVLAARRADVLGGIAADLTARHGVDVQTVAADLSTEAGLEAVESATAGLDVGLLVAAAGFGTSGGFLDADLAREDEMIDVNIRAVVRATHHFGTRFAARGRGGIVLFGSLVGFQGTPGAATYAATKAFVQTFAEALHVEWAPLGVDVLSCAPGPVHTGFADRAGMRMGTALRPADVAVPTLNALGRRMTVAPGALTKVLLASLAPLPRPLRVRILGAVMGGMTAHQS